MKQALYDDSIWSWVGSLPYAEAVKHVRSTSKDSLVKLVVNEHYNAFLSDVADYSRSENDPRGNGKRVPYIGWFWRTVNFYGRNVPIGDCGEFVGFMENNKWDYNERCLTSEEFDVMIGYVDRAIEASRRGGNMKEIYAARDAVLDELWEWFQTLHVPYVDR